MRSSYTAVRHCPHWTVTTHIGTWHTVVDHHTAGVNHHAVGVENAGDVGLLGHAVAWVHHMVVSERVHVRGERARDAAAAVEG